MKALPDLIFFLLFLLFQVCFLISNAEEVKKVSNGG